MHVTPSNELSHMYRKNNQAVAHTEIVVVSNCCSGLGTSSSAWTMMQSMLVILPKPQVADFSTESLSELPEDLRKHWSDKFVVAVELQSSISKQEKALIYIACLSEHKESQCILCNLHRNGPSAGYLSACVTVRGDWPQNIMS